MFRVALFLIVCVASPSSVFASCLKDVSLKDVSAFAEEICGEIQASGSTQLIEVDGELKAGISGIVSKVLGNAGVGVDTKILQDTYEGVLRKDLAKERFNARECKMEMAKKAIAILQVCNLEKPEKEVDSSLHEENTKIQSLDIIKKLQKQLDVNSVRIRKNRQDREELSEKLAINKANCEPTEKVISDCTKYKSMIEFATDPNSDICSERESRTIKFQDKQSCANFYFLQEQLRILESDKDSLEKEKGYINQRIIGLQRGMNNQ